MSEKTYEEKFLKQLQAINHLDNKSLIEFHQNMIKLFLDDKASMEDISNTTLYMIIKFYDENGLKNIIPQILFTTFNLIKVQHKIIIMKMD